MGSCCKYDLRRRAIDVRVVMVVHAMLSHGVVRGHGPAVHRRAGDGGQKVGVQHQTRPLRLTAVITADLRRPHCRPPRLRRLSLQRVVRPHVDALRRRREVLGEAGHLTGMETRPAGDAASGLLSAVVMLLLLLLCMRWRTEPGVEALRRRRRGRRSESRSVVVMLRRRRGPKSVVMARHEECLDDDGGQEGGHEDQLQEAAGGRRHGDEEIGVSSRLHSPEEDGYSVLGTWLLLAGQWTLVAWKFAPKLEIPCTVSNKTLKSVVSVPIIYFDRAFWNVEFYEVDMWSC